MQRTYKDAERKPRYEHVLVTLEVGLSRGHANVIALLKSWAGLLLMFAEVML